MPSPLQPHEVLENGQRVFGRNKKGVPICYAIAKHGGRCQAVNVMANGRCRMHRGNATAGINHWNAKHLRTAANLPGHLQGDMNRAFNDPDNVDLSHELALIDTKIAQQKMALESGLGTAAWKRLMQLADAMEYSLEHDPEKSEKIALDTINVIRFGVKDRELWKEIDVSVEVRRKLAETQHKREIALEQMLKGDQLVAILTAVASVCKECVMVLFTTIEARYTLVEKGTGLKTNKIDPTIRTDYQQNVSLGIGKLIGKLRKKSTTFQKQPEQEPEEEYYEDED